MMKSEVAKELDAELLRETHFYQLSAEQTAQTLQVDAAQGLSDAEAKARQARFGPNALEEKARKTVWQMFIEQFKSFMILILLIAALISGLLGEWADTIIIAAIVVLNAIMGVIQENKAENSMAALKKMSAPHCKLLRDGHVRVHEAVEIVPGDIVILETGDYVPADLRLLEAVNLQIQESALTGESVPSEKRINTLEAGDISLGDRHNMAFSSSLVTYGHGIGVATAIGMETEVGKIATMIQSADATETPLKRRLEQLGKVLGIATLVICAVIFGVGLLYGKNPFDIFLTAVSLAVAAIPEGLPAIATIVLAIGVQRMAKHNAIIRTLPAVETLGSASVICSDKTGTLTQNVMTVKKLYAGQGFKDIENLDAKDPDLQQLLLGGLLCNDSRHGEDGRAIGDPTETALMVVAESAGFAKENMEQLMPRKAEVPFDSDRKLMTTVHAYNNGLGGHYRVYTKGAVDELLAISKQVLVDGKCQPLTMADMEMIRDANRDMAAAALRVLAVAYKDIATLPAEGEESALESDLVFIGLEGMIDPPRPEAAAAVRVCRAAGIKPVMITGDHKITAMAIARQLGILKEDKEAISGTDLNKLNDDQLTASIGDYSVYARVSPEHKVRIVDAWQRRGQVVAMTGDGVNDAPALKRADIGAAMGITGTDVAKEAADMVLTDDNFATIVSAVGEGRRIFDNILKCVQFLLSCNVGEILTLFIATMLNWESPLLPIHLLWVNLVTDSLPALALGVDPAVEGIMQRKVRLNNSLFSKGMVWRIIYQGVMVGGLALLAFVIGSRDSVVMGQTMAFAVLAFSQLFHSFNVRSNRFSVFHHGGSGFKGNRSLLGALAISAVLMLLVMEIPGLNTIFHLESPDLAHWGYILLLSLAPIVVVDIFKRLGLNDFAEE